MFCQRRWGGVPFLFDYVGVNWYLICEVKKILRMKKLRCHCEIFYTSSCISIEFWVLILGFTGGGSSKALRRWLLENSFWSFFSCFSALVFLINFMNFEMFRAM